MENLEGTLLKGYKLEARIGNGGFGAVYRAKQPTVGREVAVKIILPGYANNPDFIRRFESEALLIARLEHPHITPLHDFWRDPEGAYLVMRYLRGGSVRDALQTSAYELHAVSQLLDQIASALDFAHRNNVIHRDIKPGNILLDEDGNAYLADFGIAKDLAGITDNKTAVDAVVGSLDYISPEQARSEPVTPRTDIYSLGVTLYEMVTGEHPFRNASTIERLYKHINDPLPEIVTLPEATRDVINEIIARATAKNPEDRYPDVLALAVAFRQAVGRDSSTNVSIVEQLTLREQEVLSMIAQNMSNREIADTLVVTLGTVKWHITQLYKKLGVRSRVQAIVRARELNLIVTGDTTDNWVPMSGTTGVSISLPEPENPYKGLHAFQMTDARDFFGRDDLTRKLINKMCDSDLLQRFLAVVGPSGSGKSSLVKAGLIPALWKGAITGSEKWFVVDMIPGAHPLDKLEIALIRVAAQQTANLREQLQRDERGLLRVADLILPGDDTELVIVVDQFEEVFTLVEDEKTRKHFLDLLRVAVSDVRSRVRVIVTLRADYYDRPLHYPEFGELIRSRMETVLPLSAKGLERAIRGPAERVGVMFEQGLVEQIVSAMNYQAGALPLLQYALTELFDRRQGRLLTNEAYQQIGGAVGALANRADEIFQSLTEDAQELAHQMFMRLVTLGEGAEDTRRRATHVELLSLTDNVDLMEEVIDQFAAYRLLSLDHDPETRQPTVEVAHEAILREWDRLRAWLNDSRDDIRQGRAVSRAATEWKQHQRDVSYLLRGVRLEQVEKWSNTTTLTQTPLEQEFIAQSLQQRTADEKAERERKAREAQLEQRSRTFLRGLVAVFAVATVVSIGFGIFAFIERNNADDARDMAQQSADEFRSLALTFGAQDALEHGQPDVALALALEAVNMTNPPFMAQDTFFQIASENWIQQRFLVSEPRVWDAAYHPDGRRIITTSWDGRVVIWDIETGEELQSFERDFRPNNIGIHPDGTTIAVGGDQGLVHVWDIETNEIRVLVNGEGWHNAPTFTQDGRYLVTASDGKDILVWNTESWEIIRSWEAHDNTLQQFLPGIHFNNDDSLLITASPDTFVKIWDFETGDLLQSFSLQEVTLRPEIFPWAWDAQFLPDGEHVLIGGGFEIVLWNWRADEVVWIVHETTLVQDIALSPDKTLFVVGLEQIPAQIRDTATGEIIRNYDTGHTMRTQNVDYSPDGSTVLTGSNDGTVILWTVNWEGALQTYPVTTVANNNISLAWHPTLPIVAMGGVVISQDDQVFSAIRLLDANTGEIMNELVGQRESISTIAFTPDGHYLISGDNAPNLAVDDQNVYVWDVDTGEQVFVLDEHIGSIQGIAVSADSRVLAVGETEGARIILWDLTNGESIRTLEGHSDWVNDVEFSPDGQFLYSSGRDGALYKWDIQTGEIIDIFTESGEGIGRLHGLEINEDGSQLLTFFDNTAVIWSTETGEILMTLSGHTDSIVDVEYSPDHDLVMTAGMDSRIILWDAQNGEQLHFFVVATDPSFIQGAFSPDGTQIISATNQMITFWNIPDEFEDLNTWVTENRHIPEFTCEQRALYQIEPLCESES